MSLGGGVLIAFAAVLWLLYLAPAWLQRRRYLATERTAVRLQQTLRILAETAEVPDEVRAELSARSVAEQHRALRDATRRAEGRAGSRRASAERALARRSAPPREPRRRAEAVQAIAAARLRRSRVLAGVVLVGSLGVAGFGVARELRTGDWLLTVAGGIGVLAALALLQRAATVAAAHRAVEAVDRAVAVPEPVRSFTDWAAGDEARPTWTPVPLPKPLYLDRAEAPADPREAAAAAASLAAASAQSEQALRAAQSSVRTIGPATEAVHVALGIQDTRPMLPDVDAVLRRRRAG